jgi:hypothetical protein
LAKFNHRLAWQRVVGHIWLNCLILVVGGGAKACPSKYAACLVVALEKSEFAMGNGLKLHAKKA